MSLYFFDTSAITKHYCFEKGTATVDSILLGATGSTFHVTRLSLVEFHSAFAKKLRIGEMNISEFGILTRRFRGNVRRGLWSPIRLKLPDYKTAEKLIRRIGVAKNLRSLDALQLTIALRLHSAAVPITFVCADQALCGIAAAEGLAVINPEVP